MTQPTIIHFDQIGNVSFQADRRCKRLSIRIKPLQGVSVLFPPGYSIKNAMAFVSEKKPWILKSMEKMAEHEGNFTIFNENTTFKTRSFSLKIEKAQREDVRLKLNRGILNVWYPYHIDVTSEPVQEAIRFGIEEALRMEAKRVLPARVHHFAAKHQFSYNHLFIKNLKSRWGSCSGVNNINLNLHLMRLPDHLIDYVILHELCHTIEKNHGSGFWNLMDQVTAGQAKILAAEMKQFSTKVY
ncbi:M48 family metallopeptidase [Alkalitalea saponilacus]|uniref:YgjP-like metallopeptidase domain-containing protein n=1 Tax=Alkalitalea saponilacus TaxID=889453 RepID=A0A1T5HSM7_9BACT|nr:SprT family zinc-dependent metalloprotease [Alkalitalea saponilacus]ASB49212.1 zinc protease [Alkalitalea saponilacus]SKC23694.1 hypothetical protein SAMN03080601_02977 [Alkalitalea saponilacus]